MMPLPRPASVLDIYRTIANLTDEMLAAAQVGDWGIVLVHGQRYCESVEQLRRIDPAAQLDNARRETKYELLIRILSNDAATPNPAAPQQIGRAHVSTPGTNAPLPPPPLP